MAWATVAVIPEPSEGRWDGRRPRGIHRLLPSALSMCRGYLYVYNASVCVATRIINILPSAVTAALPE